MTILMIGFNSSYPPLLERAINDESVHFVTETADDTAIDLVVVNADDLASIRRFEEFRKQNNCAAFIASYSTEEKIEENFSIPICTENACHFFPMPLNLADLSLALKDPDFGYTKPMNPDLWERQKETLETAQIKRKVGESEHREKNIRGAGKMLDALLDMRVINPDRHKEIAERLIRLERESDKKVVKVKVSHSLPSQAPTIILIDDDAVFAQWGEILGELFAAKLGAKLEFVTKLSDGIELLKQGVMSRYVALLLDVRFVEEEKSAADLWVDKKTERLLRKIPIVMFSADDDGRIVKTCLLDRAIDYFIKDDESQSGKKACQALVRVMRKAMTEDRRWIFADAIEKAKPVIDSNIQRAVVDDLDDAVRNLFRKPKLALFCTGCVYETLKTADYIGGMPNGYYFWIMEWFRNISAHNAFGDEIGYHSLDTEITFWAALAICNSLAVRNGLSPATFEVREYFDKLRKLAQKSDAVDDLMRLLESAKSGRHQDFLNIADKIIGDYLHRTIAAYFKTSEKKKYRSGIRSSKPVVLTTPEGAIDWFTRLDFGGVKGARNLLAIALTGKQPHTMDKIVKTLDNKLTSKIPRNEHLALFAAICVRLSLIPDEKTT